MALCKPNEIVRGMMDGDMFVKSLHSTLTSSVYPETGVITQRLYNICQTIFIQILMQDEIWTYGYTKSSKPLLKGTPEIRTTG